MGDTSSVSDGRDRGRARNHRPRQHFIGRGPMDGNYTPYDYLKSADRIREILNQPARVRSKIGRAHV